MERVEPQKTEADVCEECWGSGIDYCDSCYEEGPDGVGHGPCSECNGSGHG